MTSSPELIRITQLTSILWHQVKGLRFLLIESIFAPPIGLLNRPYVWMYTIRQPCRAHIVLWLSVSNMSYCLKVLLRLLNILTKVFAISEFSHDRKQNKMVGCRFWHSYMKILHRFFIWPISLFIFGYLITDQVTNELSFQRIVRRLTMSIITVRYASIAFKGWLIIYYRRQLHQLLNRFLRIESMHRLLFGKGVHVPWYCLGLHLIREIYLVRYFTASGPWFPGAMILTSIRVVILFYLLDLSMLIHLNLIKSLAEHLEKDSKIQKIQRSLCIVYFEQLLQLNHNLQQFCWVAITARLMVEIMYIMIFCMTAFWIYALTGDNTYVFKLFIGSLLMLNMLHVVKMARCIGGMECKILDKLYLHELMRYLKCPKSTRNRRLERVICRYIIFLKILLKDFYLYF